MEYKYLPHFQKELIEEFELNSDTFKCYVLESYPSIKVLLFGKKGWEYCHIGLLINEHFHVLGLGEFSFINEDKKALYVRLRGVLPKDKETLIDSPYTSFSEDEQRNIKSKLNEIYK